MQVRRGATQVCNEQGLLGYVVKAKGFGRDQAGPGRGPHTHIASVQVGAMAVVQGGQGDKQACLLARSQTLHQRHSDLFTLRYLGAWGPERPMRGIMEHAWGWCK